MSDGLVDPARYPPGWYREGTASAAAIAVRNEQGAIVSEAFADRFDLRIHDDVDLDTPSGILRLRVAGVVRDYVSDRGSVWFSNRLLAKRWGDTAFNFLFVDTREGASLPEVRSRIVASLGERYRLRILSMSELIEYLADKIDRAYAFTLAIQLLVAVVTVAGIFDLLLATIWERRRELAVWRVIGAGQRSLYRSVILESAAIGVLGCILGLLVGIVTTLIWIHAHYRNLLGYYLDLHFAYGTTLWYIALILAMTMVAGYAAARQATRQSVLEGIQAE
jgi:putative ABC transport system permease protein